MAREKGITISELIRQLILKEIDQSSKTPEEVYQEQQQRERDWFRKTEQIKNGYYKSKEEMLNDFLTKKDELEKWLEEKKRNEMKKNGNKNNKKDS